MAVRERLVPVAMARVAVAAPRARWDDVLTRVAGTGVFEPDRSGSGPSRSMLAERAAADAAGGLDRGHQETIETARSAVLPGWVPEPGLDALCTALEPLGASVVKLDPPRWAVPPTVLSPASTSSSFAPLVSTYATVPYRDVDPTLFAAIAYVVMFALMFGDVGHGLLLAAAGGAARLSLGPFVRLRRVWGALVAAGLAAAVGGLLYGEAFGPTGLPVLWLEPLEEPVRLLGAALVVGVVLLGCAFALGTVNRWREGGPGHAIYAPSGAAGGLVFMGGALAVAGWVVDRGPVVVAGVAVGALGVVLLVVGMVAQAGFTPTGILTTTVELFDALLRLGSNVVSFARVAAFGLTHAAIGAVVWAGAVALWGGVAGSIAAVLLFVVGNLAAFSLELLVAGVQVLRLEYYELFSRVFEAEGRPFRPWYVPLGPAEPAEEEP